MAPGDLDHFERRHIEDSLKALPLARAAPPGPAADLGSGAGLPGVPLAIAQPSRLWRLIEPRVRRAAFLEEVVRELDLNAEVVARSSEEAARDPQLAGAHAVVTGRALAPPARAFERMAPLVAPEGVRIVWVGAGAEIPRNAEVREDGLAIMRSSSGPGPGR